jgi:hypothetical protein
MTGSIAILVSMLIWWFSSIIRGLAHFDINNGSTTSVLSLGVASGARARLLDIFGIGSWEGALVLLVAVALLAFGSSASGVRPALLPTLYKVLAAASALVAVLCLLNLVIGFTWVTDSLDAAFADLFQYLAGIPVASAAALWAWRANT